jgi:hypothetical protein
VAAGAGGGRALVLANGVVALVRPFAVLFRGDFALIDAHAARPGQVTLAVARGVRPLKNSSAPSLCRQLAPAIRQTACAKGCRTRRILTLCAAAFERSLAELLQHLHAFSSRVAACSLQRRAEVGVASKGAGECASRIGAQHRLHVHTEGTHAACPCAARVDGRTTLNQPNAQNECSSRQMCFSHTPKPFYVPTAVPRLWARTACANRERQAEVPAVRPCHQAFRKAQSNARRTTCILEMSS